MKLQFDYTTYKYHGKCPNCGKTLALQDQYIFVDNK